MTFLQQSMSENDQGYNFDSINNLLFSEEEIVGHDDRNLGVERQVFEYENGDIVFFPASDFINISHLNQLLAEELTQRNLILNVDTLSNIIEKKSCFSFLSRLLELIVCRAILSDESKENVELVKSVSKKISFLEKEIKTKIRQQVEPPAFYDTNVPEDGNCYYYAVLMTLISACFTNEIMMNSSIEQVMNKKGGFFDVIQIFMNEHETLRYCHLPSNASAAQKFEQLLWLPVNKYDLFKNILTPALRIVIANFFYDNKEDVNFVNELKLRLRERKVNDAYAQNLESIPEQGLSNKLNIVSDEDLNKYFSSVKKTREGGVLESFVIHSLYGINITSYHPESVSESMGFINKDISLFIRNVGYHFKFGLLRSKDERIDKIHQKIIRLANKVFQIYEKPNCVFVERNCIKRTDFPRDLRRKMEDQIIIYKHKKSFKGDFLQMVLEIIDNSSLEKNFSDIVERIKKVFKSELYCRGIFSAITANLLAEICAIDRSSRVTEAGLYGVRGQVKALPSNSPLPKLRNAC